MPWSWLNRTDASCLLRLIFRPRKYWDWVDMDYTDDVLYCIYEAGNKLLDHGLYSPSPAKTLANPRKRTLDEANDRHVAKKQIRE